MKRKKHSLNLKHIGKICVALGAIGPIIYSVVSYLDTRALEAKRPLLESQFKLYQQAVDVAGRLATVQCSKDDAKCIQEYKRDCHRFRGLYWGGLAVVEDRRVEQAMISYKSDFQTIHPELCDPDAIKKIAQMDKSPSKTKPNSLPHASLRLAKCVNASLHSSWDVELLPNLCPYKLDPPWWQKIFVETKMGQR